MRDVAVAKPHLFKGALAWWCVQNGMRIGSGGRMRLIFKTIWDALLMAPLVIWLQPPWYAAMSIGALVAMLTAAAFKEGA